MTLKQIEKLSDTYIYWLYVIIWFVLSELFRGKKGYFSFQCLNFNIQTPEWPSYFDCLIKCRMLHIVIFYHTEPLIWVGLQFTHSSPINERQYYSHFAMTITWHEFDCLVLPSEWPHLSTNEWNPTGSNKICMLNTDGWSNKLLKFSIISWKVTLSDFCIK